MACGIPAVVSDAVGCAPDMIEPGRTGFVFRLGNIDELGDRLVNAAKLILQKNATQTALASKVAEYSLATSVSGTLQAVTRLVHAHPPS